MKNLDGDEGIITIAVITYNSSATVLETLDSIFSQTYDLNKIEIVISDDHSKDDTKEVVSNWIDKNKSIFFDVKCNFSNQNYGVSENCNVAISLASGKWIKLIAGDDILLPNCILDNLDYVKYNLDAKVVFSKMIYFNNELNHIRSTPTAYQEKFYTLSPRKQMKTLLMNSFNMAPTSFMQRDFIVNVIGGFSSQYRLIEDLPMWIKITSKNYKLHYFPKETVLYRISDSISRINGVPFNIKFYEYLNGIYNYEVYPKLTFLSRVWLSYDRTIELNSMKLSLFLFNNNRLRVLFYKFSFFIRPKYFFDKLKKSVGYI